MTSSGEEGLSDVDNTTEEQIAECPCGALIREIGAGVWVDGYGVTNCYPNSDNAADAAAKHEPMEA